MYGQEVKLSWFSLWDSGHFYELRCHEAVLSILFVRFLREAGGDDEDRIITLNSLCEIPDPPPLSSAMVPTLSILFVRFIALTPLISPPVRSFNSLCEIRWMGCVAGLFVIFLSILFVRFAARRWRSTTHKNRTFNSLCEILEEAEAILARMWAEAFNSLCEIRSGH